MKREVQEALALLGMSNASATEVVSKELHRLEILYDEMVLFMENDSNHAEVSRQMREQTELLKQIVIRQTGG